jgi:hypothetical protein
VEVDRLEVLFHLSVLFLVEETGLFFRFFVVFVDEVIEFDALGVGSDDLGVLGLEEEFDAADDGGFDFEVWMQSLVGDTELPETELFSTEGSSCEEFEFWLDILLPDLTSEQFTLSVELKNG